LTLEEAAKHLKIGNSSLYQLARELGIPATKYGRVWRFDQEGLDQWRNRAVRLPRQMGRTGRTASENPMPIRHNTPASKARVQSRN
jgi:excisionase family DNA binding protein